jgi:hypothetical protein
MISGTETSSIYFTANFLRQLEGRLTEFESPLLELRYQ